MPIRHPQRLTIGALTWEITGTPHRRRTRIRLLRQGPFADQLTVEIRRRAARDAVLELRGRAPVDTGELRQSIHNQNDNTLIGPRPYNRSRLKAIRAGRSYKPRKAGGPRLARYYALPANVRSRRPAYIEQSLRAVTTRIQALLSAQSNVDDAIVQLEDALVVGAVRSRLVFRPAQPGPLPPPRPAPRIRSRIPRIP